MFLSRPLATAAMLATLAIPLHHAAAAQTQWQTSWYSAAHPAWDADFILPTNMPAQLQQQTVREVLRLSSGGAQLRVTFSNRYGSTPLVIGAAQVARTAGSDSDAQAATSAIDPASSRALSFGGQPGVTVAPGAVATSDPLPYPVPALQRLSVSAWLPQAAPLSTFHWGAQQTGFIAAGNLAGAANLPGSLPLQGRTFLNSVQVDGAAPAAFTIVTLGDSITDGNGSTPDRNRRWPDYLAARLAQQGIPAGVANAGISGARLLSDGMGVKAADRLQHDVLDQPHAGALVLMLGTNDIGWPGSALAPKEAAMTAERLIAGYRALIERARQRQLRVVGATLPPFAGALSGTPITGYDSPAKDALRRQVNDWIRNSGAFDAVADFDAVLRDPAHPERLLPAYDSGDHLHPNDAGFQAMANAIDLPALFKNSALSR
ncbi:SGNH/GDSL hydrolase family protein [Massilia sp. NR 4-1]|uniref:SGNH/GDSL hydrolase family protein n=1 Tax=Massilia sp. NR 4-1 TaxID=1678028 RepID=UPI00067D38C3|nr:SGNH/GDSL hydrolase family protein [Massilia sp. NR 4-1]